MKIVFLFLVLICSVTSISAEKKNNTEIVDFSKCLLGNSQLLKDLMKLKDTKKQDLINVLLEIVPRDVQIIFGCYDKHLKGKKINIVPSLMAVWDELPQSIKNSLISVVKKFGKNALYALCMKILRNEKQEICQVFKPF